MVFQRIISGFPARSRISGQLQRLCAPNYNLSVKLSEQSANTLFQIGQKRDLFSGPKDFERGVNNGPIDTENNYGDFRGPNQRSDEMNRPQIPFQLEPKEFERRVNNGPIDTEKNYGYFRGTNQRLDEMDRPQTPFQLGRNFGFFDSLTRKSADMDKSRDGRPFGRGFFPFETGRNMNMNPGEFMRDNENYRSGLENNADIVHVKIMRNNTFVTVTDSKGNKKLGASAGALAEMKGGPKVSKYSAEATAEHIGREAKRMGLKSVVVKVNGFTFFKKKKLAILSFRDGYTNSRSDRNPIVYIEDTTRKPHNGCRRKKQRRV